MSDTTAAGTTAGTTDTTTTLAPPALPMRDGAMTIARLIDLYMAHYAGRDGSRLQRLGWWSAQLGAVRLDEVIDDHLHVAIAPVVLGSGEQAFSGNDAMLSGLTCTEIASGDGVAHLVFERT